MAIEIVDLPSYKMVIFHSSVNVYQRVVVNYKCGDDHGTHKALLISSSQRSSWFDSGIILGSAVPVIGVYTMIYILCIYIYNHIVNHTIKLNDIY